MAIGFQQEELKPEKARGPYRPRPGLLSREVIFVTEEATLKEAAHLMREHHIGDLVVVRVVNGLRVPVGLVTDRDLSLETYGQDLSGDKLLVCDIMTREIATASIHDDVFQLIERMKDAGVGRLPLVDDEGSLAGIITAKRLTCILLEGLNELFQMSEQRAQNECLTRN